MNRTLGALSSWVNGESPLFQCFHQQVGYLGRTPSNSAWDTQRASVESVVNPFSFDEINFCALTLNDQGMTRYGPYSVLLHEKMIQHRSTVFEENPFIFARKHKIIAGTEPPKGFRSTWPQRHLVAIAKHHSEIRKDLSVSDYASIVIKEIGDGADNEYIEVHIFGTIHRNSIRKVSGPVPSNRPDKAIWRQVVKKLRTSGVQVEEI